MQGRQKRFPWLGHVIVFCLIGLFTMAPVIWLAVANAQKPGATIGLTDLMASWGVLGWLVMTSFVMGPFLVLFWSMVVAIHFVVFLRARKGAPR